MLVSVDYTIIQLTKMKYADFRSKMIKPVFSTAEAQVVAFGTAPATLRYQLHQWIQSQKLIHLKRGVYAFADQTQTIQDMARALYAPCYISLEWALNAYNLIPDIPFSITLVTSKSTREFKTPRGHFTYQTIKKPAFSGYDPHTLLATKEKALVDFFYLTMDRLTPRADFWEVQRWQNLETLDFKKVFYFAGLFQSKKLKALLESFYHYATTRPTA